MLRFCEFGLECRDFSFSRVHISPFQFGLRLLVFVGFQCVRVVNLVYRLTGVNPFSQVCHLMNILLATASPVKRRPRLHPPCRSSHGSSDDCIGAAAGLGGAAAVGLVSAVAQAAGAGRAGVLVVAAGVSTHPRSRCDGSGVVLLLL